MKEKLEYYEILSFVLNKVEPFGFIGHILPDVTRNLFHLLKKGEEPSELRYIYLPEQWLVVFNDKKKTFAVFNSEWLYTNRYKLVNYTSISRFPRKLVHHHIDKNQHYEEFLESYEKADTF